MLSISVCLSRGAHGRGGDAGSFGLDSRTVGRGRGPVVAQAVPSGSRIKVQVKVREQVPEGDNCNHVEAMRLESIQEKSETSGPSAVWSGLPAPRFRF